MKFSIRSNIVCIQCNCVWICRAAFFVLCSKKKTASCCQQQQQNAVHRIRQAKEKYKQAVSLLNAMQKWRAIHYVLCHQRLNGRNIYIQRKKRVECGEWQMQFNYISSCTVRISIRKVRLVRWMVNPYAGACNSAQNLIKFNFPVSSKVTLSLPLLLLCSLFFYLFRVLLFVVLHSLFDFSASSVHDFRAMNALEVNSYAF